jgi:hypothetical protein
VFGPAIGAAPFRERHFHVQGCPCLPLPAACQYLRSPTGAPREPRRCTSDPYQWYYGEAPGRLRACKREWAAIMARTAGRMAWIFGEPRWGLVGHRDTENRQRARAEAWSGAKSFRQRRFLHGSWFLAVSEAIGKAAGGTYRQLPEYSRPAQSRRRIPTGFHQPAQGCEQRATLGKPFPLPSSTLKGLHPRPAQKPAVGPQDTTLSRLETSRAEHPG